MFERNKSSNAIVMYSLYLYFLDLSLRNTSKTLVIFKDEKRSYVSVWNWIQRFDFTQIYKRKKNFRLYKMKLLYRLVINISGYGFVLNKFIVQYLEYTYLRREICLLIAEKFIRSLVEKYGKHIMYTDGGIWYDEACNVIGLKNHLHSQLEKSLMERVNQYFKDRIECSDDYYPCIQKDNGCNLFHVHNWIQFFVSIYNDTIYKDEFIINLQEEVNKILN